MAPVPVLMLLYSNDAAEIRYSDGSILELSPCGSTMIYHPPSTMGQHPMHRSSRSQKRTRFVTSEHRHKVLQALDFRNRFAERPYLCRELLEETDIVALYANLTQVSWPKSAEEANIEVLSNGSKKINSLDDYTSVIMSPHGQDLSICYLSKISEDQGVRKRLSESSPSSFHIRPASEPSQSGPSKGSEGRTCVKGGQLPSEAVVHPYLQQGSLIPQASSKNSHVSNRNPDAKCELPVMPTESKKGKTKMTVTSNSEMISAITENLETVQRREMSKSERLSQHHQEAEDSIHNTSGSLKSEICAKPFPTGLVTPHDISSISRSSSPDGLRTMVDTDATLSNETGEEEEVSEVVKLKEYNQKHSSPAQYTSSPYEAGQRVDRTKSNNQNTDIGLSGSFIGEVCQNSSTNQLVNSEKEGVISEGCNDSTLKKSLNLDDSCCSTNSLPHEAKPEQHMSQDNTKPERVQSFQTSHIHQSSHGNTPPIIPHHTHPPGRPTNTVNTMHQHIEATTHNVQDPNPMSTQHTLVNKSEQQQSSSSPSGQFDSPNQVPSLVPSGQREQSFGASHIRSSNTDHSGSSWSDHPEDQSACRYSYVWTTKHISRQECPPAWAHPFKLLLQGTGNPSHTKSSIESKAKKGDKKKCVWTSLPLPTPLTCPFQHSHTWRPDDANATRPMGAAQDDYGAEFQRGLLKVVISEGIVYRLVKTGEMRAVEIHLGDGTMMLSQGMKAHFFTHFVPVGDKLEERTYSLKASAYMRNTSAIDSLIKRAHRFFTMTGEWDKRGLKQEEPCWKMEAVAIVEPLSSSLLEDCVVDGMGKFSAFTNGRVRIVFEDRTALDTVADFSARLREHSASAVKPFTRDVSDSGAVITTCRLLLPNGEFVHPNMNNLGDCQKYVEAAKEWVQWVNTPPYERKTFYSQHYLPVVLQQAADLELKKIFCFNHMLEMQQQLQRDLSTTSPRSHGATTLPRTSPRVENSQMPTSSSSPPSHHPGSCRQTSPHSSSIPIPVSKSRLEHPTTLQAFPKSTSTTQPRLNSGPILPQNEHRKLSPFNNELRKLKPEHAIRSFEQRETSKVNFNHGSAYRHQQHPSFTHVVAHPTKTVEGALDFMSVKDALAMTASMINDIDSFLENKDDL